MIGGYEFNDVAQVRDAPLVRVVYFRAERFVERLRVERFPSFPLIACREIDAYDYV